MPVASPIRENLRARLRKAVRLFSEWKREAGEHLDKLALIGG